MPENDCGGSHRFFVASTVGIEREGKVVLLVVCTACGETFSEEFRVSDPDTPLVIEEKN